MISSSLVDDVHFATNLIQDCKDEAIRGLYFIQIFYFYHYLASYLYIFLRKKNNTHVINSLFGDKSLNFYNCLVWY